MGRKAVDTRKFNKVGTRKLFGRILIAFMLVTAVSAALLGRIVFLGKAKGTEAERKVLAQQSYRSNEIKYKRGDITDRNGNRLAASKKVYDLALDPVLISAKEEYITATANALDKVFGISEKKLKKVLEEQPKSQYYVMQDYKGLEKDKVTEFKKLVEKDKKKNIKGVIFEERYERYYPYSTVASKVIGFCSSEDTGIWGIENQYNSQLSGTNGRRYGYFNSDLELVETVKNPVNGNNIVTTLDANVQGILERQMKEFQEKTGSLNMGCIIMNPQNGEIYAMSSYPEYDLNNPRDLSVLYSKEEIEKMSDKKKSKELNKLWRNFCISDAFEPGSTFKPVTVAACLDEGVTNPKKLYFCDGFQKVSGTQIKCVSYSAGGHRMINICQSLMESCNDVMMQIGAKLGREKFVNYVRDFGFGQKTGIDLPGEGAGGVFTLDRMRSVELATSSFGQGQTVTMIQLAAAFSAVINGGNYYEPHVVKEVTSPSGAIVSSRENTLVRKVITEGTSEKLREYLFETVENGTAGPAKVAGYEIGGKTGTAEKHPTGRGNYLVSFAGFTPVDKPEVMIYLIIDEPNVKDQAHSIYATELSSQILKEVLPLLGVYQNEGTKKKDKTKASDIKIPSTKEVPKGGFSDKGYEVAGGTEEE
ncbi:peptidoglycan glycosyltransferase [bacterium D16-51]|nr:peptidoglycan glycosyltransferase [bacterium D16-59]RKI59748.1 peptidoglycan glycosyltransferase [bacterium D16-51]